jgi:hypothetical protein
VQREKENAQLIHLQAQKKKKKKKRKVSIMASPSNSLYYKVKSAFHAALVKG